MKERSPYLGRTANVLNKIEASGTRPTDFCKLPPEQRFDLLAVSEKEIEELSKEGNFPVFFPSSALLFNIFGRLPTVQEICYEVNSGGFIQPAVNQAQVEVWQRTAEKLFSLLTPEVEEMTLQIQRRAVSLGLNGYLNQDEYLSEAHLAMRTATIFGYQWRKQGSLLRYLRVYVSLWLKNLPHPLNFYQAPPENIMAFKGKKRPFFRFIEDVLIAEENKKENLEKIKKAFAAMDQKRKKQVKQRFSRKKPFCFANQPLWRQDPKSQARPPFLLDGKSVFALLTLRQVFEIISQLPPPHRFLVLSHLGYFPFQHRDELAKSLGYGQASTLFYRDLNRAALTKTLAQAVSVCLENSSCTNNKPEIKDLIDEVEKQKSQGILARWVRQQRRMATTAEVLRKSLLELNSSDFLNQEINACLTPRQKKILAALSVKDKDIDGFRYSVSDIAELFDVSYHAIKIEMKQIEDKLKEIAGFYQKSQKLPKDPKVLSHFAGRLSGLAKTSFLLFVGLSEKGEWQTPLSLEAISQETNRTYRGVWRSLRKAFEEKEKGV